MHYYIHNRHCYKELSCTPDDAAELTTVYSLYPSCFFHPVDLFPLNGGQVFWVSQAHFGGISLLDHRSKGMTADACLCS